MYRLMLHAQRLRLPFETAGELDLEAPDPFGDDFVSS
jgi:hypothetical protein